MAFRKNKKFNEFEERVAAKRRKTTKSTLEVPSEIMVQKMSSTPSGRLKKYEPIETRDFVPFEEVRRAMELTQN